MLPIVLIAAVSGGASQAGASPCTPAGVSGIPTSVAGLSSEQLVVAQTTIGVGQAMGVGQLGEVDAIVAGLTESGLRNLPFGDRDSLGVWQMRPSQGWGTPAQILDVPWAAVEWYQHLKAVAGWQQMDPASAAQQVERSAFPTRYQGNVALSVQIVTGVSGAGATLTVNNCMPSGSVPLGPSGANLPPEVVAGIDAMPPTIVTAIKFALAQVGKPYVWGATGPEAFDCSGLMLASWASAGVSLPRTTYEQVNVGVDVTQGPWLPGDLFFPEAGHVGMYLGSGLWVEAPHTGDVVKVTTSPPVWRARRIVSLG